MEFSYNEAPYYSDRADSPPYAYFPIGEGDLATGGDGRRDQRIRVWGAMYAPRSCRTPGGHSEARTGRRLLLERKNATRPTPNGGWGEVSNWLIRAAVARKNLNNDCRLPVWGMWLVLRMATGRLPFFERPDTRSSERDKTVVINISPLGPTHFHPIYAGGGFQRDVTRRNELFPHREAGVCVCGGGGAVVPLNNWGDWYDTNATMINAKFIESSTGGPIADATRKLYKGHFAQRATFRRINGLPYSLSHPPTPRWLEPKKTSFYPTCRFPRALRGRRYYHGRAHGGDRLLSQS